MSETPWEFAEQWYHVPEIERAITNRRLDGDPIPTDVYSHEFAVWLTTQYRLAMAKGIQIGRDQATLANRGE